MAETPTQHDSMSDEQATPRPPLSMTLVHFGALGIAETAEAERDQTDDQVLEALRRHLDIATPLDTIQLEVRRGRA